MGEPVRYNVGAVQRSGAEGDNGLGLHGRHHDIDWTTRMADEYGGYYKQKSYGHRRKRGKDEHEEMLIRISLLST